MKPNIYEKLEGWLAMHDLDGGLDLKKEPGWVCVTKRIPTSPAQALERYLKTIGRDWMHGSQWSRDSDGEHFTVKVQL